MFLPVILRYYTNEVAVDAKIDKTFKKISIEKKKVCCCWQSKEYDKKNHVFWKTKGKVEESAERLAFKAQHTST